MATAAIRRPLHAGSWYSSNAVALAAEVDKYLIEAAKIGLGHEGGAGRANRVTAIVGPHAGYRFCGEVLGSTYAHMPVDTKRIVVIGPSHHVFMEDAALTRATTLASPVGNVAVDVDAVAKLMKTGLFSWFDPKQDEEEHSVEMHLPFIVRSASLHKHAIPTVVPIIVGHVTAKQHRLMAAALAPLLAEPGTIIAVSTDFCHWGSRFRFTGVDEAAAKTGGLAHGIAALDKQGMEAVSTLDPDMLRTYLDRTGNTICGREALCIALEAVRARTLAATRVVWPAYAQSSRVESRADSSVSYAAGLFLADDADRHADEPPAEAAEAAAASS